MPNSKPPFSISAIVDNAWNRIAEAAFNTGWAPITRLSETAVVALMQKIACGQLRVLTYSHIYTFPLPELGRSDNRTKMNEHPYLKAELRVLNDSFWVRLCTMGDLGFAEAYMYGDVECDDLVSLFKIFLENRENLSNLDSKFSYLFTLPQKLTSYRFLNTIGNSRSNISAHYDISNEMFAGFLSEDMTYSCAIFPELDGDLIEAQTKWSGGQNLKRPPLLPPSPKTVSDASPDQVKDPLYLAQIRKLQHIIDKLRIPSPSDTENPVRILEIGTGWGALAIRIAQQYPHTEIDTITLSSAQQVLAEKRIAMYGLENRIRVHLMDYRNMPSEWEGRFSRFVSVEMIEAVGREFLEGYWRIVDWAMEKKGAVGVVQVISIPEARFERYIKEIDFIRKWVLFPGGFLPTVTLLTNTLSEGSKGHLIIESIANIGPHYARTLREWRRRFLDRFESVIVPALQKKYASGEGQDKNKVMSREEIEVFKRKWIYYYCYCEVGFTTRTLGDHIMTFMREGNQSYSCDVPGQLIPLYGLPSIPDNLTIPQFMFDVGHEIRPKRRKEIPWLIQDESGEKISEEQLRYRIYGLANGLSSKYKIGEHDIVLLFSRNHVDYPIALWAVHRLGGVISGANPDFTSNELVYQLQETKASLIIVHPDSLLIAHAAAREVGLPSERIILFDVKQSQLKDIHHQHVTVSTLVEFGLRNKPTYTEQILKPGEGKTKLALLSFSSGTTGRPKAVAIPHFAVIANVIQMTVHNKVGQDYCKWEDQRYRPGDVAIGVLPLYHIYGLVINLHYVLFCGMSLVVVPKFNLIEMLNSIVRHRISHLMLVPPQVVLICKHPAVKNYDLRQHVRMIMCGAAPLSHELNEQLFEMFPTAHIGQAYGMTETCTATIMWSITRKRGLSGSSGHLLPGTIAKVVKPDGSLAGYDEPGELVIKTASIALGYANNLQATKDTFLDGWVRTGDEVKIREDGEVFVLDRTKEIMKVKGFQVAPAELEGCILDHVDVSNACVVGVPDDYSGEVPLAFVVLTTDAKNRVEKSAIAATEIKKSIIKHVADNKVHYKHLHGGVEFVSVIPTSPSGKLLRRLLRDQAKELIKKKKKGQAKL